MEIRLARPENGILPRESLIKNLSLPVNDSRWRNDEK